MYAVIKTGGKQYRVAAGEKLKVEQIPADIGAELVLDQVLMVGTGETVKVGSPLVSGANVKVTVLAHGRHANPSRRQRRHRQRSHPVCVDRRQGAVSHQGREEKQGREYRADRCVTRTLSLDEAPRSKRGFCFYREAGRRGEKQRQKW